jgi:hypothetical protein
MIISSPLLQSPLLLFSCSPLLLNPKKALTNLPSGVFVFFFLPELKGRSLEELDYMFEAGVPTRKFSSFDSSQMVEQKRHEHGVTTAKKGPQEDKVEYAEAA